jgi:hypothetical protein
VVYYNVTVNIHMCYSNPTIVNIYWYYRKLVYKIIVNRGGYRITYFVASYWTTEYIYIYIQKNHIVYGCILIYHLEYVYILILRYSKSYYVKKFSKAHTF